MSTLLRKRVPPDAKPKKLGATRLSAMDDKENRPPVAKCKSAGDVCTPPQREPLRRRQENEQHAESNGSPMVVASDGGFFYCNEAGKEETAPQAPATAPVTTGSPRTDAWGGLGGLISSLQTKAAQLLSEEPVTLFEGVSVAGSVSMPTVESVFNQSIDAINVVGRVALAVGTAIDNAIEGGVASLERMHNYDSSKEATAPAPPAAAKAVVVRTPPKGQKGKRVFSPLTPAIDGWDAEWGNPRMQPGSPASPMTVEAGAWSWSAGRTPSPEQLKAEQLQRSVEHLRDEFSQSKAECEKLTEVMRELAGEFSQADGPQPRPSASQKPLKITRIGGAKQAAGKGSESPPEEDPLAEQVRVQMEWLVQEKARLAMENARLQRENKNLQELLMYHMEGDDDIDEETPARSYAGAGPAPQEADVPSTSGGDAVNGAESASAGENSVAERATSGETVLEVPQEVPQSSGSSAEPAAAEAEAATSADTGGAEEDAASVELPALL